MIPASLIKWISLGLTKMNSTRLIPNNSSSQGSMSIKMLELSIAAISPLSPDSGDKLWLIVPFFFLSLRMYYQKAFIPKIKK